MAQQIKLPGTKGGPCRRLCGHEACHSMKVIAGFECWFCEEQIGWNIDYEQNGERYVHSECLAQGILTEQERQNRKSVTTREVRGAPQTLDCWQCAATRLVDDDCIVAKCLRCRDSAYEYDVPGPLAAQLAELDAQYSEKVRDFLSKQQ